MTDVTEDLTFVHQMWADDGASAALGMEAVLIESGHAVVEMTVTESMVNGHGICHGGYVFLLADSTFALACNTVGTTTVAAGADINFIAATRRGDRLRAEGRMTARYGRNGIYDISVTHAATGDVVAEFRGRSRTIGRRD